MTHTRSIEKLTIRRRRQAMAHTVGIDLGDKSHETCALNEDGEAIERSSVLNNRDELIAFSRANRHAVLIMEAGTHSPWISRLFQERRHKVIVANPRKLRAIYETDNKNDQRDAEMLARPLRFLGHSAFNLKM